MEVSTPPYPVEGHPLVSRKAQALDREALKAHAQMACLLLLLSPGLKGDQKERATLAVVEQVNFQVEADPRVQTLKSESVADQKETYRENVGVSPRAVALARGLVRGSGEAGEDDGEYATLRSLR